VDRPSLLTRPFVLVCLSSLATLVAVGMLLPVLPLYAHATLGLGKTGVGLIVAASTPASILLQPFLGRYADRAGRRRILLVGPLLYAVAVAGFTLADSTPLLVLFRVLSGIGEGAMFMAPATVINDLAPAERRGEAVSLFSLSVWGGLAVGPPLGELVLRDTHFDAVWLAIAALCVVGAGFAAKVPETRPHDAPAERQRRLRIGGALLPSLILVVELVGYAAIVSFTPLYARDLGMSGAGLVFMVNALVVVAIRGLGRKIPDRLGPRRGVAAGLTMTVSGLALVAAVRHPAGLFVGTGLFYAGHSLVYPALMMLLLGRTRADQRSATVGLFSASAGVGYAVGAVVLGAFAGAAGYPWGFAFASLLVATGFLPLLRMAHVGRSRLTATS
jgi:MFS family permease